MTANVFHVVLRFIFSFTNTRDYATGNTQFIPTFKQYTLWQGMHLTNNIPQFPFTFLIQVQQVQFSGFKQQDVHNETMFLFKGELQGQNEVNL